MLFWHIKGLINTYYQIKEEITIAAPKTSPTHSSPPLVKPKPKQAGTGKHSGKKGRPSKSIPVFTGFHRAAAGETRNSPMTSPNIIFWLGIALIIFSGYSNGRIRRIFSFAFNGPASPQEKSVGSWLTDLKVFGSQFLFLFILVITARAIPPLSRIWLVMVGGMWVLYLMKNPQVLQLLNWTSQGGNPNVLNALQSGTNSVVSGVTGNNIARDLINNLGKLQPK